MDMGRVIKSEYRVYTGRFEKPIRLAVVSDLHSRRETEVSGIIEILKESSPDYILMPGDIFERLDGTDAEGKQAGFEFIEKAAGLAPVFYSVGNHENGGVRSWDKLKWSRIKSIPKYYDKSEVERIVASGAVFLDDSYVIENGIAFGGLSSGLINEERKPNVVWLDEFCALECPKILLCHHPEYYENYLKDRNIELIVSGHAHGGQWRIFGRGVFAPGQGIFPKYTSGVYGGKMVVSRGLKPSGRIPRIFNPPEVVVVEID